MVSGGPRAAFWGPGPDPQKRPFLGLFSLLFSRACKPTRHKRSVTALVVTAMSVTVALTRVDGLHPEYRESINKLEPVKRNSKSQ